MPATRDPIRHVIVLMLENRSFDQMLGDLRRVRPDLDGIDRAAPHANLDPNTGKPVLQAPTAANTLPDGVDIGHEPENVDAQLALDVDPMSGFVKDLRSMPAGKDDSLPAQVMAYFPVGSSPSGDTLPALHALARNFVVCDKWYSSVPGPTWPNRLFALTGTSAGYRHMWSTAHPTAAPPVFGQDTIFDRFADKGLKARVYASGLSMTTILSRMWWHPSWRQGIEDFEADVAAAEANFPAFAWIEPDYFGGDASDQHPPHDVMRGDAIVARVYNTLRQNDALWNSTLLIVTHDEHGGFYDHSRPPGATPPDDEAHDGFAFNRLGVRVPAVLVSPWLDRVVCHSTFDHTSVLRYLADKWQLRPLGRRAAAANSIAEGLSFLPAPRTDVPATLIETKTRALVAPPKTLNATQEALLHSIAVQEAALGTPSTRTAKRALTRFPGTPRQRYQDALDAYNAIADHYRDLTAPRTLRVFCVHGVGHGDADPSWRDTWRATIAAQIAKQPNGGQWIVETEFAEYDDIFDEYPLGPKEIAEAILRLTGGLIEGTPGGARRGLFDALTSLDDRLRWTAGMVVQWIDHPELRDALCKRVGGQLAAFQPNLIAAHSLGTLISYDLLRRDIAAGELAPHRGQVLLTFGSQIAHPAVLPVFDGRIEPLHDAAFDGLAHWYHLYNARDRVFTRPLPLADAATTNLMSEFDCPGDLLNHDATCYLARQEADDVWAFVTSGAATRALTKDVKDAAPAQSLAAPAIARTRRSKRRALLIGINQYPDPSIRLEGCVNDTFLMSSVLQEYGFEADDIRLLLDERATRDAMLDRMEWLVDGMQPDDVRFLFYSGHGAQIPAYGPTAEPDGHDETLVPYDFDWSDRTAFTDKQFHKFYSQLPYDSHLICVFDCCHAEGMTRGSSRVRGLDPPDDVRHRALRWSKDEQMWVARDWMPTVLRPNRLLGGRHTKATNAHARFLGQATLTRSAVAQPAQTSAAPRRDPHDPSHVATQRRQQTRARKLYAHKGPYMPLMMYACGEQQYAAEYEHGSVSYGAFTYVLAKTFRAMNAGGSASLESVMTSTSTELERLGYAQTPQFLGSKAVYSSDLNLRTLVAAPRKLGDEKSARRRKKARAR